MHCISLPFLVVSLLLSSIVSKRTYKGDEVTLLELYLHPGRVVMTSYTVIAETFLRIIRKLKSPWRINHNGAKYAACSHHLLMNMELALEVEHSVAIKRKKPWPKLCWLGEVSLEHESLFL